MLKMTVVKHHAASNDITNSMEKNATYNYYLHFTEFYPMGPVRSGVHGPLASKQR